MQFTYAIGDLHGRLDVLDACLAKLGRREPGKIVFLGDYIDRGPDSRGVVERLMAGSQDHHEWVVLKGNHEEMAMQAHGGLFQMKWWTENGGDATLRSYGSERIDPAHLRWMDQLPLAHTDERRLYVHAGIKHRKRWESLDSKVLLWVRHQRDTEVHELNGLHVVHGHTPFEDGPVLLLSRTNLDTKVYKTGRAVIAVFDDLSGPPRELIEVRAKLPVRPAAS
jgi:serine/threonine protein phosphatase 1